MRSLSDEVVAINIVVPDYLLGSIEKYMGDVDIKNKSEAIRQLLAHGLNYYYNASTEAE